MSLLSKTTEPGPASSRQADHKVKSTSGTNQSALTPQGGQQQKSSNMMNAGWIDRAQPGAQRRRERIAVVGVQRPAVVSVGSTT